MRRLLDTNAYTAAKRGAVGVVDLIRRASQIVLPTVVVGELLFGFRNGTRFERNFRELEEFLGQPRVTLAVTTLTTCDRYGRIASALRAAGTPIPTNDVWVAAHALELGAELVSYDSHFGLVAGLPWVQPPA